jgi:hypothetical protein|tara:strand:- start:725 stop:829 length:105 start_codon:yes stop_codon:yes gene_type:complete
MGPAMTRGKCCVEMTFSFNVIDIAAINKHGAYNA